MKTIELHSESCHGMVGIEKVMDKLRFMTGNVDVGSFDLLLDEIHSDRNASGQFNGPSMCSKAEWGFEDKGRFLFNYMIGKLNTRLYEHTQNVADHNGWEVLRVIIEFMDKPPDNAKFQMDMKLNQLIQDKEGKSIICKNVKDVMKIIQTIENATVQ